MFIPYIADLVPPLPYFFGGGSTVLPKPWWWWWCCAGVRSNTVPWEPQTHFLYDYSYGKMLGGINLWSWMIKKNYTLYRMIWCSITRRGHIKSQYLQIIQTISAMQWENLCVLKARIFWYLDTCVTYIQTYNHVLVVENKSVSMRTLRDATVNPTTDQITVWLHWDFYFKITKF